MYKEQIKKQLISKVNLNKLNTNHKIKFTLDQSNNVIKDFTFQLSNKEKIYLKRNVDNNKFNKEILVTKLKKRHSIKKILLCKVSIGQHLIKRYQQI